MKPKHTPGPWKIKQNAPCEILSSDGYTDRVAIINPDLGNSNWMQDARLIAAAPDMLEVLEKVQTLVNGSNYDNDNKRLETWDLVDKIINKVKGQ